eukprot:202726-Rhodomonas_salina.5
MMPSGSPRREMSSPSPSQTPEITMSKSSNDLFSSDVVDGPCSDPLMKKRIAFTEEDEPILQRHTSDGPAKGRAPWSSRSVSWAGGLSKSETPCCN